MKENGLQIRRALDDQVGAPTAVFGSELEVNLVVRHLALENQLVGRALVVGGNPERDSVAIDLALFDVGGRTGQPSMVPVRRRP